ncbi:GNAT family N-acetyltransferase, partial [Pseudomonas aeruginosa]|uniref:GNAT family N-acetyltransferase n=1 Tax=Pseudomonas aeruginosa TaxID=287 RepID=UPI002F93B458
RLVLREWTRSADDRAFLFDLYRRPEVRQYIGDGRTMTDADEVDALLERWTTCADGVLGIRAVTTLDGTRLGAILLKPIPWSDGAGGG